MIADASTRLKLLFFLGPASLLEAELLPALFGMLSLGNFSGVLTWRTDNLPLLERCKKGPDAAADDFLWQNFCGLLSEISPTIEHQRRESGPEIRACDRASRWASEQGEALLRKFGQGPIGRLSREQPKLAWQYFDARPWLAVLRQGPADFNDSSFATLKESVAEIFST